MAMRLLRAERPAYYLDLYRVVPRALLLGYGYMAWRVAEWFITLHDPSGAQAAFPSVIFGAAPLVLNFYCQNGVNWDRRRDGNSAVTATAVASTS